MATQEGFAQAHNDSLVFAFDGADLVNGFKGPPSTNLIGSIQYAYGEQNSDLFKTHYGTRKALIPHLGEKTVHYVDIYIDYNGGYGNCCLSLFSFGQAPVSQYNTYYYQIIYRTVNDYYHPNYMYQYQYGSNGYITEYGVHNPSNRYHLGDGWYMAWGTITTPPSISYLQCYLFHYEYATYNRVELAGVMINNVNYHFSPRAFLNPGETRSATQSLIDLTGRNTIDVSNCSIGPWLATYILPATGVGITETTEQLRSAINFDGSDDRLVVTPGSTITLNDYTIEVVFRLFTPIPSKRQYLVDPRGDGGESNSPLYLLVDTSPNQMTIVGGNSNYEVTSPSITPDSNRNHVVLTRSGSTCKIYWNGDEVASGDTGSAQLTIANAFRIGTYSAGSSGQYFLYGNMSVARIYSKALTEEQIKNNYTKYKHYL